MYPSLELCELSAKEFEFHLLNLEGMGIHEGFEGGELHGQICLEPAWNAAYKKGRCLDQENHGVISELSVHRDTRPERRQGTRIHRRS